MQRVIYPFLKFFNVSVISCSTPEHRQESPSRDSDSLCDSEAASPVPFLCTQDGSEGETDVVWNFYTPKSEHAAKSRLKNSTPLSRKTKKIIKTTVIEKPLPKRRTHKPPQKKTELFQDLIELNENLHEFMAKKPKAVVEGKRKSGSEEDIFSDSGDSSPKSGFRANSKCLRRNVLSSKFNKQEIETALESDDSMNECLIKASQVVEENILNQEPTPAKRPCLDMESKSTKYIHKPSLNLKMDHDSMDAILNSIKLVSPTPNKTKTNSSRLINDSFDSLVGNLNDSALDRLTQLPSKSNRSKINTSTDWTVEEVVVHDSSPISKSFFGRHSSMPESPIVAEINKPSTSGMVFGRYNSMPHSDKNMNAGKIYYAHNNANLLFHYTYMGCSHFGYISYVVKSQPINKYFIFSFYVTFQINNVKISRSKLNANTENMAILPVLIVSLGATGCSPQHEVIVHILRWFVIVSHVTCVKS